MAKKTSKPTPKPLNLSDSGKARSFSNSAKGEKKGPTTTSSTGPKLPKK